MTVLRPQFLEQRHGLQERGDALYRAIRHVGHRLPLPAHSRDVGSFSDEVPDKVIVPSGGRVMERRRQ